MKELLLDVGTGIQTHVEEGVSWKVIREEELTQTDKQDAEDPGPPKPYLEEFGESETRSHC